MANGLCIFCGTPQVGVQEGDALYRCHRCNLHLRASWLVDDLDDFVLNNEHRWLCPWCAYPVGLEQTVPPENAEFICDGCGGTLIGDMLVTQANVNMERKVSMRFRGYVFLVLAAIVAAAIVFGWVVGSAPHGR